MINQLGTHHIVVRCVICGFVWFAGHDCGTGSAPDNEVNISVNYVSVYTPSKKEIKEALKAKKPKHPGKKYWTHNQKKFDIKTNIKINPKPKIRTGAFGITKR